MGLSNRLREVDVVFVWWRAPGLPRLPLPFSLGTTVPVPETNGRSSGRDTLLRVKRLTIFFCGWRPSLAPQPRMFFFSASA